MLQLNRQLQAITEILLPSGTDKPRLIIFEDQQWADGSSRELAKHLVNATAERAAMLIFATREDPEPWCTECDHLANLSLGTLSNADAQKLVDDLTLGPKLPKSLVEAILRWSGGVPLDIEEYTRNALDDWSERFADSRGIGRFVGDPGHVEMRLTRRDAVKSYMDRISANGQAILPAASTIGREFTISQLRSLLDLEQFEFDKVLDELQDAHVIQTSPSHEGMLHFRHARFRDVAYESMSTAERRHYHTEILRQLVLADPNLAQTRRELLAHHFEGADDWDNAIHHWIAAGDHSLKRAGYLEAVTQLERAVALLERVRMQGRIDAETELRLYASLGTAYEVRDGFSCANALQCYKRALDICRTGQSRPSRELFATYSGFGSLSIMQAEFDAVVEMASECIAAGVSRSADVGIIIGTRLRGGARFVQGHLDEGIAELEEAVRLYDARFDANEGAETLYALDHKVCAQCYLAFAKFAKGEVRTAIETVDAAEQFAKSHTNLMSQNYSSTYHAAVLHLLQDHAKTLEVASRSRDMAIDQGFASWEGGARVLLGHALVARGNFEQGQAEFALGRKIHESQTEARMYVPWIVSVASAILDMAGQAESALETGDYAVHLAECSGELWLIPELLRVRAEQLYRAG